MFQYFLYKIGQALIYLVPRKWAYAFALFLSDMQFFFSRKDRDAVINNLKYITKNIEGLNVNAREVFRNFGRYLVDFFLMYQINDEFIRKNVTVCGQENFDMAFARRRGVIILTAHIGNWEMGAVVLSRLGYKLTAVALPHKHSQVNGLFNRQRMDHGVTIVPTNMAVRKCLKVLQSGDLVALLGDRDFGSFGEAILFLGRLTQIPKGAAFLSLKTKAAIVPSFFVPDGCGRYTLSFSSPIFPPENSLNEAGSIREMVKKYVDAIEVKVRENPTQWLMFREFGVEHESLYTHSSA